MLNRRKTAPMGQIRIIGGMWRGRKLPVLDREGLRPTTDRVRETLFNWLAPDIVASRCLDCFAGSGALGFEALSRQAKEVVFIELDRSVAQQLDTNVKTLQATDATVLNTSATDYLSRAGTPFDIVFIDPPFRKGMLANVTALLERNNWLADDAIIYVETESESMLAEIPNNWRLYREKKAGQVAYRLFVRDESQNTEGECDAH